MKKNIVTSFIKGELGLLFVGLIMGLFTLIPYSKWLGVSVYAEWVIEAFGIVILIGVGVGLFKQFIALYALQYKMTALGLRPLNEEPLELPTNSHIMLSMASVLRSSVYQLTNKYQKQYRDFQEGFATIVDSIADCVIVINNVGIITLCNSSAINSLKPQELSVGYSIFSIFNRKKLAVSLSELNAGNQKSRAYKVSLKTEFEDKIKTRITKLKNEQGYVICFSSVGIDRDQSNEIFYNFKLKELKRKSLLLSKETPLEELLVFVFDTEATGLNVKKDAVISLGGVYCLGTDIHSHETVDFLLKPDMKVRQSIAIHGISDKQLENKSSLKDEWIHLEKHFNSNLLVGHNVGYDLALIQNNLQRFGIDWQPKYFLDTLYLAYSLLPHQDMELSLDALVAYFDVPTLGRHTALGDALMTSNVFTRLLAIAEEQGDKTLDDLIQRQNAVKVFRKEHSQMGWVI